MTTPTFAQLKKAYVESGFEIRPFPRRQLERMALDAPAEVKRHMDSNIMGLIMPDLNVIGLASDLTPEEKVTTLVHELVHLVEPDMAEDDVENVTLDLEDQLTPAQYGFLQFLIS